MSRRICQECEARGKKTLMSEPRAVIPSRHRPGFNRIDLPEGRRPVMSLSRCPGCGAVLIEDKWALTHYRSEIDAWNAVRVPEDDLYISGGAD